MKSAQPVIEKPVGKKAVKGSPAGAGEERVSLYYQKNRNIGKPRKEGNAVFKYRVWKRSGE